MNTNIIYNEDCLKGMKELPDKCVDLIVTDPPYECGTIGGGCFGNANREYLGKITPISNGITNEILDQMVRVMKKINIYIWCNKVQIPQYIDYFVRERGCTMDILTWHKSNPTPMCSNKYLSDTEYCLFFREKGVKVYGTYDTKHKYMITAVNKDKDVYNHPTVKPLEYIKNLVINSSNEGEVVLVPFIGSGTTAVACKLLNRQYIGYEIDEKYYNITTERINNTKIIKNVWF